MRHYRNYYYYLSTRVFVNIVSRYSKATQTGKVHLFGQSKNIASETINKITFHQRIKNSQVLRTRVRLHLKSFKNAQ